MLTLTLKQARKILGKDAQNVSDAVLESDIQTATLLKDLFFDFYNKRRNGLATTTAKCHNTAVYGKTSSNLH